MNVRKPKKGDLVVLEDSSEVDPQYIGAVCTLVDFGVEYIDHAIMDLSGDPTSDFSSNYSFSYYSLLLPDGHVAKFFNENSFTIAEGQ